MLVFLCGQWSSAFVTSSIWKHFCGSDIKTKKIKKTVLQKFASTHREFSLCFLKWCNTDFNPNQIWKKMTNSCGEFIIYLISLSFIRFAWLLWRISRYCSVQDIEDPSGRERDERRQIYKRSNITKASLVLQTILPLQPSLSPEFPNQHHRWHHRIFCKRWNFFTKTNFQKLARNGVLTIGEEKL